MLQDPCSYVLVGLLEAMVDVDNGKWFTGKVLNEVLDVSESN